MAVCGLPCVAGGESVTASEWQRVDGGEMLAAIGWQRERVDGGVWIAACRSLRMAGGK